MESISRSPEQALKAWLARQGRPDLMDATQRWLEGPGRHLVTFADARYPEMLRHIDAPPHILFAEGRVELLAAPALAIVGSRNATSQGVRDAELFARTLSERGITVVSGLALGIDAAAHRGALEGSGSSIAIMGTGPDIRYPPDNRRLAQSLAERGCLLSEFPLGTPPLAWNFPRRNRLISGLSKGVLVVEAGMQSGTLTTARLAVNQGRDVFAMPGSIHSPHSKGCHWLIKEGAKLVEEAQDVLVELGWAAPVPRPAPVGPIDPGDEDEVLAALGFAPASLEQLAMRTGLDAGCIAARVSMLELEGSVVPLPGGNFQRVSAR
jgi:DNA processing protein